jgi:dTMP kinase
MVKKGLIVYFDGPDGVGKTTQLNLAEQDLKKQGYTVHSVHTIGGTPIGDLLRDVLFSDNDRPAETNLHIALASQHALADDVIRRRDAGEVVLIDRSPLSMIAYQVYGDGLAEQKGYRAAEEILDLIKPDLLLVYMADLDQLLGRRRSQADEGKVRDHFELQDEDYHSRTTEGYKAAIRAFDTTVIDATGSVEVVHAATENAITSVLGA